MTLITYLTRTHFAAGAIEDALPEEVGPLGSALMVVDATPGASEACDRVQDALPKVGVTRLSVPADGPRSACVSHILKAATSAGAAGIIAIGGAAAIGQARLAGEALSRRGRGSVVIAIPIGIFDLGFAREVRPRDGEPIACVRPSAIILDPTVLTFSPTRHLAASGMEVLVHAMEAYANPSYNPPADGLALDAVRRLSIWLPKVSEIRSSAEARRELMAAALSAGLATEKSSGGVDALAHRLEDELYGKVLPGELHAPLLAAFIDFNARAVGDRYAALSDAMGRGANAQSLVLRIVTLARALGLPAGLREAAADRSSFASMAQVAADDPAAFANPRRLTAVDCRTILEAAW